MILTGLAILASGFFLMTFASVPEVSRRVRGLFFGWVMAGVGALVLALGNAPLNQGLPVWNPVLRNTFGWTAGQMSWAFAVTRIEGGLLGPLEGLLIERLGPRRMVFIGMSILGAGFLLFSQVRELWHLYTVFFIMSMGAAFGAWLPMMTVMNHWFVRRRSRAMSVVAEGFAIGGMVIPVALAWAIGGTDPNISVRFGWRATSFAVGIIILAVAFPLSRLVRNRPEDMGLRPDGDGPGANVRRSGQRIALAHAEEQPGFTWQEAIRTRAFWLISFGHAGSAVVIVSIFVHLGLMLDERGFSLQIISAVVAAYTGANAVFTLVGGYASDRLPVRYVAFVFSALQSLSLVVVVLAHSAPMVFLFAFLLGIGFGGRTPATTAIRGVYFGRRAFATITGISMVPMNVLLFAAPLFAGYMRDFTGNYSAPFLMIALISFLASCSFLLLGEPASPPAQTARSPLAAD